MKSSCEDKYWLLCARIQSHLSNLLLFSKQFKSILDLPLDHLKFWKNNTLILFSGRRICNPPTKFVLTHFETGQSGQPPRSRAQKWRRQDVLIAKGLELSSLLTGRILSKGASSVTSLLELELVEFELSVNFFLSNSCGKSLGII